MLPCDAGLQRSSAGTHKQSTPSARTQSRTSMTSIGPGSRDDGFTIPASVPGDVVTDLQPPARSATPCWTTILCATRRFGTARGRSDDLRGVDSDAARIVLAFDGVKMGASVNLNHVPLGTIRDQFLRYAFDVRNASIDLLRETNKLELIFDPSIDVGGRFAACSGGWDWAPT